MSGKVYKKGKINILELSGNYRQMGREYGRLFKDNLKAFYDVIINEHFIKELDLTYELIKEITGVLHNLYPKRFKEIFSGMAETSGMDLEKIIILDHAFVIHFVIEEDVTGCSAIACWKEYTGGGPLVFGRNFDYPELYKKFGDFVTLLVIKPDDGSIPTASFGHTGQISVNTAMNRSGIFLANNEAVASGGTTFRPDISHALMNELAFLLDCSDMNSFDAAIRKTQSNGPVIANMADKEAAYSYEWPPFGVRCRKADRDGLLVSTNHYIDPSWGIPEPISDVSERTLTRRKNLLKLGEKYKGNFNREIMKNILDMPIAEGGATHLDKTIYQVVAVPEDLTLDIKIPDFQDWVKVDLKAYFGGR